MRLLLDMMMRMTEEKRTTIKLIHGTTGSMCSIAQLLEESVRLATHWRLLDHVRPGDIVAIVLDNHPHFYTPVMAAWLCGAGVSLIGPDTRVNTMASMLSLSQSRVVVISPRWAQSNDDLQLLQNKCDNILKFYSLEFGNETVENISNIVNDPKMDLKQMNINDFDLETNCNSDDIAAIFWSSGTTGHPKGIPNT